MRPRKLLGAMLVEGGLLTQEQLEKALVAHKQTGMKLGKYLVKQGVIKEEDAVKLLSVQLKIRRYDPEKMPIEPALASAFPVHIAQKYQMAPLAKSDNLLTVAMIDPTDINSLDAMEEYTGMEIEPVICTEEELNQMFGSIYGMALGRGGELENLENIVFDATEAETHEEEEATQASTLADLAEGASVIRMVNWIISQAVQEGASDIHISPERTAVQLRFRLDGKLREMPPPPKSMLLPVISRIKILAHMDISVSRLPQDGRFSIRIGSKEINIRVSSIPTIYGENIVMRLLNVNAGIYTLNSLGMHESDRKKIEAVIQRPHGMVLSTGPTGSGKTTCLYSILKLLNQPDVHIITVEDPVEYRVDHFRQIELNIRAGMTFAAGLRSILRQDPDIIMVGEIRDPETASVAVQAALTGHLVLSTVHTNDAAGAITRLIDMGIEPFLVASVLSVSLAQRLLRKVCEECAKPAKLEPEILAYWGLQDAKDPNFRRGAGCLSCRQTGYSGRTGIFEVMLITEELQSLIIRKTPVQEIVRTARASGEFRTLKEDAAYKILAGVTTPEEAAANVVM